MSTTFVTMSIPPRVGEPSSSSTLDIAGRPPSVAATTSTSATTPTTPTTTTVLHDPFLLVHRRQLPPPPRPRGLPLLFALAALDLGVTCTLTVLSAHGSTWDSKNSWHWNRVEWDVVALAVLRVCAVVAVGSSVWIRDRVWIVGGVCVLSTLLLIFKSHFIYQKRSLHHKYEFILHATSLIFSQAHWIAFTVVTADRQRRARLLHRVSFVFEEERPDADEIAAYQDFLESDRYQNASNNAGSDDEDNGEEGDPLVRRSRDRVPSERRPLAGDSSVGVTYGAV